MLIAGDLHGRRHTLQDSFVDLQISIHILLSSAMLLWVAERPAALNGRALEAD